MIGLLSTLSNIRRPIRIICGAFPKRKIGLTINVAVAVVAILRLFLGGGII